MERRVPEFLPDCSPLVRASGGAQLSYIKDPMPPHLAALGNPPSDHAGATSMHTMHVLKQHARFIQQLGRRVGRDVIEIGRRLVDAKRRLGHGRFLCWIAREFGWTERTAERFMSVHALAGKFDNLSDLEVPISALYLLAAPSTPNKALEEVAMRVGNGNGLSIAEVKEIIANSRRRSPLRHVMRTAREILAECERSSPDVRHILDRRFAELPSNDYYRQCVADALIMKCRERSETRSSRIDQLKGEMRKLELIENHLGGFKGAAIDSAPQPSPKTRRNVKPEQS
jgi:hypothetical protein